MPGERSRSGLERVMNALAESGLKLSAEEIVLETTEGGADPAQEAKRTALVLQHALQQFEYVNRRLSHLGHTVNPRTWRSGRQGYENRCLKCGSIVTFAVAEDEVRSQALDTRCPARDFRPAITQTGSGS
jgi:hypothetical protein